MSGPLYHLAALFGLRTLMKMAHALQPEPSRLAIKLMLAQLVARNQMDSIPLTYQPQCGLPCRDSATYDRDCTRPIGFRPTIEVRIEYMMDAPLLPRLLRPSRLRTGTDREHHVLRREFIALRGFDPHLGAIDTKASCTIDEMDLVAPVRFDDVLAMGIE